MIINSENDLENSAFRLYPNLFKLKNKLLSWKKAEFVRMTGSGSTLVMYFNKEVSAKFALHPKVCKATVLYGLLIFK